VFTGGNSTTKVRKVSKSRTVLAEFEILIVGETDTPESSKTTVRCLNRRNVSLNNQVGAARVWFLS
jgi:hypothetical protein